MPTDPSPRQLLVLSGLHRTPAQSLLKAALAELVEEGVYVQSQEGSDGSRRRGRALLGQGTAPAPPGALARVAAVVESAPLEVVDGAPARDVAVVARRLAVAPGLRGEVLSSTFGELAAAGWVTPGQRRVLLVLRRAGYVRTAAGEQVLAARRSRAGDSAGDGGVAALGGSGGRDADGPDRSSSFDSSFDGGFSGGDGAGGDGGGGGD